jgi:hypothetical protein
MSNLYGYVDYHGPRIIKGKGDNIQPPEEEMDDDDDDPLRSGLWMEGDSLAPPCGSSVSLIHSILSFGSVSSEDILYDFGCGDGRVCLEALVERDCRHCVGVEIEHDLVQKAQSLIANLPKELQQNPEGMPRIQVLQTDLRDCIRSLLVKASKDGGDSQKDSPTQELPMPTIIVLYLLPEAISALEDDLISLLKYARIVCNTWGLPSLKETVTIEVPEVGGCSTSLFLYDKR